MRQMRNELDNHLKLTCIKTNFNSKKIKGYIYKSK